MQKKKKQIKYKHGDKKADTESHPYMRKLFVNDNSWKRKINFHQWNDSGYVNHSLWPGPMLRSSCLAQISVCFCFCFTNREKECKVK